MRPMRLIKRQVTDADAIKDIVDSAQVLHIGAMDDDGMFIVPVSYGYEWSRDEGGAERLSLYLHSAQEGRKAEAFCADGTDGVRVAIELEEDRGNITGTFACAYSRSYRSVMGSGIVRAIEDPTEKERALRLIMNHAAPDMPSPVFTPDAVARVAIFRIDVDEMSAKERAPKQ